MIRNLFMVPLKTEPVPAVQNEYQHIDRTGHKQFYQERIKGWGLVVSCAVCGEQVQAKFAKLAQYGMDVEKAHVTHGWTNEFGIDGLER